MKQKKLKTKLVSCETWDSLSSSVSTINLEEFNSLQNKAKKIVEVKDGGVMFGIFEDVTGYWDFQLVKEEKVFQTEEEADLYFKQEYIEKMGDSASRFLVRGISR